MWLVEPQGIISQLEPYQTATILFSYLAGIGLQYFWFWKIAKGALKVITGGKAKAQ